MAFINKRKETKEENKKELSVDEFYNLIKNKSNN